jgi:hypothetical protein
MVTTGAKWFFGITGFALVAAAVYGWGSGGGLGGVLTAGFKGGVGELAGFILLLSLAGAAALVGCIVVAFRDADVHAAETADADADQAALLAAPPVSPSYWPVVGAFGAALVVLGFVVGAGLVAVGLFVVGAAVVEWMVQAWADRATGDPEANRVIRNRIMHPLEVPIAGAVVIGAVVFLVSRILLSLPKAGSNAVAILAAVSILTLGFVVAARKHISRRLVTALLVLGALLVLAAGVVAAASGEREFEPHEEEPAESAPALDTGWGLGSGL